MFTHGQKKKLKKTDENFIYKHSKKEFIPFAEIEEKLNTLKSANEKFLYLKNLPKSKNRFSNS